VIIVVKPFGAALRLTGMKKQLGVAAGLALALAMAGCGSAQQAQPVMAKGVAMREPLVNPRPYGAADTAFGLDVLGAWCRADPQDNLVLSPSSLASGLGMAYLGARGSTAQAMASVLRLPLAAGPQAAGPQASAQELEAGLQARSTALRQLNSPGVTLQASDQVWADPTLKTLPSYLDAVATGYDAGVAQAPLLSNPGRATAEIDAAISAATHGQIPQLLAPGSLDDIGWVLTDALYMKAAWAQPFDPSATNAGPFTTASGQRISAEFMTGGEYRSVSEAGWTAVSLPYRGGKLAMTALLPDSSASGCTMPALGTLTTARAEGPYRAISIPRVSLSTKVSMKSLLTELGMGIAFTGSANFTGLSPHACCIGLVEQAATLKVAEQGTVASAATAVGMQASAVEMPRDPLVFDRPYLLVVTDHATGEPLFMARVANPAAH
jgi:serine protease inhibitor